MLWFNYILGGIFFILSLSLFFCFVFLFVVVFFSLNIRPSLNHKEFNFFQRHRIAGIMQPAWQAPVFLVGFYRAREGKTRSSWNLRSKKSKKKTVACYADLISIMRQQYPLWLSGECGRVKREKKNNDEVIMGNHQTEADGKKNIIDLTSGFKSKKLIILVLLRISAQLEFFLQRKNSTMFQCTFSGSLLFGR